MIIPAMDNYNLDDTLFDTMTDVELKAFIEDYISTNWNSNFNVSKDTNVSVCPLMDGHFSFGNNLDWREIHG